MSNCIVCDQPVVYDGMRVRNGILPNTCCKEHAQLVGDLGLEKARKRYFKKKHQQDCYDKFVLGKE